MTMIELIAHTVKILKDNLGEEFDNSSIESKEAAVMFALNEIIHADHYAKHVIAEIFRNEYVK